MGACISIHHKASAVKVQSSFDSAIKPDHTSVIHPSPTSLMDAVKPQLPLSQSPATFSDYGSREETFFDSQAWLDSDYEDEFMSVNGGNRAHNIIKGAKWAVFVEFTPSRGSTPVHHSLTQGTPRVDVGATFTDHEEPLGSTAQPSPTPTEKRRRLLDLFKESLRDNHHQHDSNFEIDEPSNKYGKMSSMQGCFKSLLSVRSTGKQKSPNPNLSLGGGPVVG